MREDILERKDEILSWISEEKPKSFICQQLHCKPETFNSYLKKMGIEYKGQQNKKGQLKGPSAYIPATYYFDNKHPIQSSKLREKLYKDGLKEKKCEICGISKWLEIELPLELHHKNGNHFDNSFENLQILCPNCHSIQEGNSGANAGKYAGVSKSVEEPGLDPGVVSSAQEFKSPHPHHYCSNCGKEITSKSKTGLCSACWSFSTRKSNRPTREELKNEIRTKSFLSLAEKYEVSDNAIRKWCIAYNLPKTKKEINSYSNEEWKQI